MSKDDLVYVGHTLDTSRKAASMVHGKNRSAYDSDEMLRLALAHLVQVVGSAVRTIFWAACV